MTAEQQTTLLLAGFGLTQILLGLFIVIAPGTFADSLGAFGERNDHLARDSATVYFALGFGLVMAARRPAWRPPVLAVATVQYAAHAVNHLVDVGDSDPGWIGPADVIALIAGAGLLGWLWRRA